MATLTTAPEAETPAVLAGGEISLLLFTVGEVRFGVVSGQVEEIRKVSAAGTGPGAEQTVSFRGKTGFRGASAAGTEAEQNGVHAAGTILYPKNGAGILVDGVNDVARVSLDAIRPLPALLEKSGKAVGIWGAAFVGEEIVLLADLV